MDALKIETVTSSELFYAHEEVEERWGRSEIHLLANLFL